MNKSDIGLEQSSRASETRAAPKRPLGDKPTDKSFLLESTCTDEAMTNHDRLNTDEAFRRDHRAEAFLNLERQEALMRYPELSSAYAALDVLQSQFAWRSASARASILDSAKAAMAVRIRNDRLPALPSRARDMPDQER